MFILANYLLFASADAKIYLWGKTESCILVTTVCKGAVKMLATVVPANKFATLLRIPCVIYCYTSGVV